MDNENEYGYGGSVPEEDSGGNVTGMGTEYSGQSGPLYSQPQRQSNMALASLVMGIIGIVTSCCCMGGMIFGGLGILFALLSKMSDRYEGYAKAGLITSIIAVVLSVTAGLGITIYYIFSMADLGGVY